MQNKVIKGCGGVILKDNKVLLMKRKNTSTFNNLWSNPGGIIEKNESAEEAVTRELKEELGVNVKIINKIADYIDKKNGKIIGIYSGYLIEVTEGVPSIMEKEKAEEIRYFSLDALPENIAPYTKLYLERLNN